MLNGGMVRAADVLLRRLEHVVLPALALGL